MKTGNSSQRNNDKFEQIFTSYNENKNVKKRKS